MRKLLWSTFIALTLLLLGNGGITLAYAGAQTTVQITHDRQVVDSFNGVDAVYIIGKSDTGEYSCAGYVSKYYSTVYGVSVSNLLFEQAPVASTGSFSQTSHPESGDIGYHRNGSGTGGHWFIIKEVNNDGSLYVIEQNWKWTSKDGNTFCYKERLVPANKEYLKCYHWSEKGAVKKGNYTVVMTANQFITYLKKALSRDTSYNNNYPYNLGYYNGKTISWDCWNLGKSIIWSKGSIVDNYTVGHYASADTSCGLGDWDGLTIIQKAPNCGSDFSNLVPGEWLYLNGHTGYYIGNGQVIECTASWGTYCVTQSQIDSNGNRSRNGVSSGKWLYHGMVPWIDYSTYTSNNFCKFLLEYPENITYNDANDIFILGNMISNLPAGYIMAQCVDDSTGKVVATWNLTKNTFDVSNSGPFREGIRKQFGYKDSDYTYLYCFGMVNCFKQGWLKGQLKPYTTYTLTFWSGLVDNGKTLNGSTESFKFSTGSLGREIIAIQGKTIEGAGGKIVTINEDGISVSGETPDPSPVPEYPYVHVDYPKGTYDGTHNIEVSGWVASHKAPSYVILEYAGRQQRLTSENMEFDSAVNAQYGGIYEYTYRFRGVIPLSHLQSNSTYTLKTSVGFVDSSLADTYYSEFGVGNISAAALLEENGGPTRDFYIVFDQPSGTYEAGASSVPVSGWLAANAQPGYLMAEYTNGSSGDQLNLNDGLVEDSGAGSGIDTTAYQYCYRFTGSIPIEKLEDGSQYSLKVFSRLTNGVWAERNTAFSTGTITGKKSTRLGFELPFADGDYAGVVDISGWIASDSPIAYAQYQIDSSSGQLLAGVDNIHYWEDAGVKEQNADYQYGYRFKASISLQQFPAGEGYKLRLWVGTDKNMRSEISRTFNVVSLSEVNATDYFIHMDSPVQDGTYSGSENFEVTGWIGSYAPISYGLFQIDPIEGKFPGMQNSLGIEDAPDVAQWLQQQGYTYTYAKRFRGVAEIGYLPSNSNVTLRVWMGLGNTGMTNAWEGDAVHTFRTGTVITPTYPVSFDPLDGSGAPETVTKTFNDTLTLPTTIPARMGYTFMGWTTVRDSSMAEYLPGDTYTENLPATMYAVWQPATMRQTVNLTQSYTVEAFSKRTGLYYNSFTPAITAAYSFRLSGSNVPPIAAIFDSDGAVIEKLWTDPEQGDSWALEEGRTYLFALGSENYADGTYSECTLEITRGSAIHYDAEGGTDSPENTYYRGSGDVTLAETAPTRSFAVIMRRNDGTEAGETLYREANFLSWKDAAEYYSEEAALYQPGDVFGTSADVTDVTLCAVWEYPAIGELPIPEREGYIFTGWVNRFGQKVNESYVLRCDEEVVACWERIPVPVEGISLEQNIVSVKVGTTKDLTATVYPEAATEKLVLWTVDDVSIAYVDVYGTITAVGTGSTTVHATTYDGRYTADCPVIVFDETEGYPIIYRSLYDTELPKNQIKPQDQSIRLSSMTPTLTHYTFTGWEALREDGTVLVYQPGALYTKNETLYLTARWTPETYPVLFDPNGGDGAPEPQTKKYGQALTLSDVIPTRDGFGFGGWSSDPTAVRADYAAGTQYEADQAVTLYAVWLEHANGVSLNYSTLAMSVGASKTLKATVTPAGAAGTALLWSSSQESVASVKNGTITAQTAGQTVITCTVAENPALTASCTVTVGTQAAQEGSLEKPAVEEYTVEPGDLIWLNVKFVSENAAFAKMVFSYDESALELISASANGTHVTLGSTAAVLAVSSGKIPDGTQMKLSFRVLNNASAGRYTVDTAVVECYTIDENATNLFAVAADSVRLACEEHSPVMLPPMSATHSEDGLSLGWQCEVCGEPLGEQTVIEASKCFWLPDALSDVEAEAFANTVMQQIVVPSSVRSVGDRAFAGCPQLLLAVIPETVEEFGEDVFSGCTKLCIVTPAGSEAESYAKENGIPFVNGF